MASGRNGCKSLIEFVRFSYSFLALLCHTYLHAKKCERGYWEDRASVWVCVSVCEWVCVRKRERESEGKEERERERERGRLQHEKHPSCSINHKLSVLPDSGGRKNEWNLKENELENAKIVRKKNNLISSSILILMYCNFYNLLLFNHWGLSLVFKNQLISNQNNRVRIRDMDKLNLTLF